MEDWVKLESFDRPHQAEIRKTILEQNNINAVVINAKTVFSLSANTSYM